MKPFIKLAALYIVFILVSIIAIEITTSVIVRSRDSFSIKSKPENIILGHSHVSFAFNDSIIKNFVNASQTSEAYFYTYFKTKQLLSDNKEIKTVFIGFTNNQITESINQWIWNTKNTNFRYPKYASYMGFEDQFLLLNKNSNAFLDAFSISNRKKINDILLNNENSNNFKSGYIYSKRNKTDSILASTINSVEKLNYSDNSKISKYNLKYLSKIIKLCKAENKRVILVRSPVHKKWTEYKNEKQFDSVLKNKFSEVEFLDFSKFPLPNSEFGDLEHLNSKGANSFSNWFNNLLSNGLLETNNIDSFVANEIRNYKVIKPRTNTP